MWQSNNREIQDKKNIFLNSSSPILKSKDAQTQVNPQVYTSLQCTVESDQI